MAERSYQAYSMPAVPALQKYPQRCLEVSRLMANTWLRAEGDDSNLLSGHIRTSPKSVAILSRIDATGKGRGTYLTAGFVHAAYRNGSERLTALAIHPGTVAIFGALFGPDAIDLRVINTKAEGYVPYEADYYAALDEVEQHHREYTATRHTTARGVLLSVDLTDPLVRASFYGDAVPGITGERLV